MLEKKNQHQKKPQTNKKKGFIRQAIGHRWEYILPSVSYMQENTYAVKSYSSFLSCILSQIQWDILTPSWKIWQLPPSSEPYPSDNYICLKSRSWELASGHSTKASPVLWGRDADTSLLIVYLLLKCICRVSRSLQGFSGGTRPNISWSIITYKGTPPWA